ncbi:MAG: UDP-glucose 4-epimerase GalE [Planctomycetota bacterium]
MQTGSILVAGGAGYIGSHAALALREQGYPVLVVDDLCEGHREAVVDAELVVGSLLDPDFLARVFRDHEVAAVMHFAAHCYVGESVTEPGRYYRNNVVGTLNLLDAMVAAGVESMVFSSSCATYGEPATMPITEAAPQQPVNPYGESKLWCERLIRDLGHAHGIRGVALRYFNAAGADPTGRMGEDHRPETHLIPLVLRAAAGQGPDLTVFGRDYPTADGTCVRDYVHVTDLAAAHVLALEALPRLPPGLTAYNLGNEQGTSVLEVIHAVEAVCGARVPYEIGPRRAGDPPTLVGSSRKIQDELSWQPRFGAIETIVETAWHWHRDHPEGYGSRA